MSSKLKFLVEAEQSMVFRRLEDGRNSVKALSTPLLPPEDMTAFAFYVHFYLYIDVSETFFGRVFNSSVSSEMFI